MQSYVTNGTLVYVLMSKNKTAPLCTFVLMSKKYYW